MSFFTFSIFDYSKSTFAHKFFFDSIMDVEMNQQQAATLANEAQSLKKMN